MRWQIMTFETEGCNVTKPIVPVRVGDIVYLKKAHPCGFNRWEVTRVGMDIGLRCCGCDRKVMLVRSEFDRRYKGHEDGREDRREDGNAGV